MSRFAYETTVSVAKSKAELEGLLQRYGATAFATGYTATHAHVTFELEGRTYRFDLSLPAKDSKEITHSHGGRRRRSRDQIHAAWEKSQRSTWRSVLLLVKANLDAIENGWISAPAAFLPYAVLEGGLTLTQALGDRLSAPGPLQLTAPR